MDSRGSLKPDKRQSNGQKAPTLAENALNKRRVIPPPYIVHISLTPSLCIIGAFTVTVAHVTTLIRRLRNRLSQQAFRERQAIYVKELEKKLECSAKPESERNAELERANQSLREGLLDCHKKLATFQAALYG